MACGTGTTLVGLVVAEATESTCTRTLAPSPSLLAQMLREWTANAERAFRYLAVCSNETVVGEDAVVSTTSELPEHGREDAVPSSRGMKRHPALISEPDSWADDEHRQCDWGRA